MIAACLLAGQQLTVPVSSIAANLRWIGPAISEQNYTTWGASPVIGEDGRTHLFAARWPEANVDPAWRKSSEIAHYVADKPEGPFEFVRVVATGSGKTGDWDAFAPHNPEIKKFGDTYALFYIGNTDYHQPPHPYNQTIGMMTAKSLDGPWKSIGQVLASSPDPDHWTHGMQVVNPAIIKHKGRFLLYFKSRQKGTPGSAYAVATSDRLTGPYTLPDQPLTSKEVTIEDGTVFKWKDKICLITTDNHGQVTGEEGGGALWVSDDGLSFNPAWTQLGYYRAPKYKIDLDLGSVKRVYGGAPKLERPKILTMAGEPTYLYAPSGWVLHGGDRTANYVLKIDLPEGASPMPSATPKGPIDVYLLSGQSNMMGLGDASFIPEDWKEPILGSHYFAGDKLIPFEPGAAETLRSGSSFGPEVGFAKRISELRPGRDFAIIKHDASGQPLHHGMNGINWVGGKPKAGRANFFPGENADDPNKGRW
jgi:hypothetical protein